MEIASVRFGSVRFGSVRFGVVNRWLSKESDEYENELSLGGKIEQRVEGTLGSSSNFSVWTITSFSTIAGVPFIYINLFVRGRWIMYRIRNLSPREILFLIFKVWKFEKFCFVVQQKEFPLSILRVFLTVRNSKRS